MSSNKIEEEIDLKEIFKIISNYKWSIIFITFLITILAGVFAYYKPNIYQTSATLELEPESKGGSQDILAQALSGDVSSNLETEKEVIKSRYLVHKVIKELNSTTNYIGINKFYKKIYFYKDSPLILRLFRGEELGYKVIPKTSTSFILEVKGVDDKGNFFEYKKEHLYGKRIKNKYFEVEIDKKKNVPLNMKEYIITVYNSLYYADFLRNNLSVSTPSKKANILRITYNDYVPQRAKDFIDTLTKEYMKQALERKTQEATFTLDFVNKQLEIIKKNLKEASKKLEKFKQRNKTVNVKESITQISTKLAEYENQKSILALKIQAIRELVKQIRRGNLSTISLAGTGIEDASLSKLIGELQQSLIKKKELLKDYTPSHPDVQKVEARISQLRVMISRSIRNILANLQQQQGIVIQKLKRLEKKLKSLPKQEQDYIGLERNFLFNEKFYTYLMEKKTETEIKKAATISKNRILDSALLPKEPIKPKRKLIMAIGVILGLILGLVLAFIRAALDNTIKEESDIKNKTTAPVVGVVPYYKGAKSERRLVVLESPKSPEAEAFRNIRTNLQFMVKNRRHNVISVTSTVAKEGKTSITANLAATLHLLKKSTIILSLDLRKPTLHKIFEVSNIKGVSSYLSGNAKKEEIIFNTQYEYIDIIPSGPVPPNPNELIASEELSKLIDELKGKYDYVLLDTPPIGLVADTKVIVQHSDLTLYVIKANYSKKEFLNLINELYEKEKISLGVILNGVKVSKKGYGYGYGSGYGYGYY